MVSMEFAPEFTLPDSTGTEHSLTGFRGKWVVLYFYPKDSTPGCSREAREFSELSGRFAELNAVVVGISKDSPKSHERFIQKQQLSVLLLSDEDHRVMELYGVWKVKKNYGREYMGTVRTTLLINPEGIVVRRWDNVRVAGHASEVLDVLSTASRG